MTTVPALVSHPDKTLFPEGGVTKARLARYYRCIAETMIPLIRDRPLTMQRFPDGIDQRGFYQKQRPRGLPRWVGSRRVPKADGYVDHVLPNGAATLVALTNMAMITPHVTLYRVDDLERPDRIVFDLDPENDAFQEVVRGAVALRLLLKRLGLSAFVQTTGSRGLHVVSPIRRRYGFAVVRRLARAVAHELVAAHPDRFTTAQRIDRRKGRTYIDVLRNAYGQTTVAPYGVRALPGAPVATPLDWSELGRADLGPQRFTVHNVLRRLGQKPCPWAHMARHARTIGRPVERLQRL